MGFLNKVLEGAGKSLKSGMIDSGRNKPDGGHDHRTNKSEDRTPAQKEGDRKKRKD